MSPFFKMLYGRSRYLRSNQHFIGIDISKFKHDCTIIDDLGNVVTLSWLFSNDSEGFSLLTELLINLGSDVKIGFESTGHYGQNLKLFLVSSSFTFMEFNPLMISRFVCKTCCPFLASARCLQLSSSPNTEISATVLLSCFVCCLGAGIFSILSIRTHCPNGKARLIPSSLRCYELLPALDTNETVFAQHYGKKRAEGKPHRVAMTHVAKKLLRVIFTLQTTVDF